MENSKTITEEHETITVTRPKPLLGDDHPLNDVIGSYDGPIWDMILDNIQKNRKLLDRQERAKRKKSVST